MKRSSGISRKTPLSRARLRTAGTLDPARSLEYAAARVAVYERAAHRCELCSIPLGLPLGHAHHRRLRGAGRDDSPANLLWLCAADHRLIHAQPTRSLDSGRLISRHDQRAPSQVPVSLRVPDAYFDPWRWFLLTDDGARIALAEPPSRP